MEDSFSVRVDKVFGTLGSNTASSVGVSPSLWCLTDEEVEKREWNRNKEVDEDGEEGVESELSMARDHLESDLHELCEDEEAEEEEGDEIDGEKKKRRRDNNSSGDASVDEYLDIQSNIGRDCTLDHEEEEDEYDKVAVGEKQTGDRIYMRNAIRSDDGIDEPNGYSELPKTFQTVIRDPRANHLAAKIRLREDAEAAGDFDNLQLSDNSMSMNLESEDLKKGGLDVDIPKPILKKRENPMDSRTQKRVRFMVDSESSIHTHEDQQSSGANGLVSEPHERNDSEKPEQTSDLSQHSVGVPDYVRNPSKYKLYELDSSEDMDNESNQRAYMDFFHDLRKRNSDVLQEDASVEMPKSIVFTPKKKPEHDSKEKRSESEQNTRENLETKSWPVGIAAEDNQESEISAMEEDEPSPKVDEGRNVRKSGRQYRTRTNADVDDNLNCP